MGSIIVVSWMQLKKKTPWDTLVQLLYTEGLLLMQFEYPAIPKAVHLFNELGLPSAVMSNIGMASGQWVNWSIHVRM